MNLSFWERKTWLSDIDFAIIGSGIVGLNTALFLRKKFPNAKIVIFERGILPSGASTKNAGFACFGSISEILEDLKTHSEEEVVQLVQDRVDGLQILRETVGDRLLDYQQWGGYELFSEDDSELYNDCFQNIEYINSLLKPIFKEPIFSVKKQEFGFQNVNQNLIFNNFEAQIDTGKMMMELVKIAISENILILNSTAISKIEDIGNAVLLEINDSETISVKKLAIATNGFAKQLLNVEVKPARAQVLITEPIKNLKIKGTFHLDKGYYYFRNIGDRILFGGGRNLDFKAEETTEFGLTSKVQQSLENKLKEIILPNTPFKIEQRWSGIMGVGNLKKPIVQQISNNVFCGVRLGGMGVAIGSNIGRRLGEIASE